MMTQKWVTIAMGAIVTLALPISAQLKTDLWQAPPASQQFRNDYAVSVEGI